MNSPTTGEVRSRVGDPELLDATGEDTVMGDPRTDKVGRLAGRSRAGADKQVSIRGIRELGMK